MFSLSNDLFNSMSSSTSSSSSSSSACNYSTLNSLSNNNLCGNYSNQNAHSSGEKSYDMISFQNEDFMDMITLNNPADTNYFVITEEEKREYQANKSVYLTERLNRRELLKQKFQDLKLNSCSFKLRPRNFS